MRIQDYHRLMAMQASRRAMLKGAAGTAALAIASSGALGALTRPARAQDDLRAELLKIPGVGAGSPTDADWQKVGEMTLGATKASIKEGEFAGVELTFRQLKATLDKASIKEISPAPGERFDPHRHQAMAAVPSEAEPNSVVAVLQKGYALHDRVLRPALVTIAKALENKDGIPTSESNPSTN